jgi:hypothetical protein
MLQPVVRTRAGGRETDARSSPRTRGAQTLAGAVACALCCAAFPISSTAADSDFSDFRIPKNRALLWTGGLNTRANGQDHSIPTAQASSGSVNGDASTRVSWFSDSDPAFTSVDVSLRALGVRDHRDQQTQSFTPTTSFAGTVESTSRELLENWALDMGLRRYPWAMPLGVEASLSLGGNYSQSWTSYNSDAVSAFSGGTVQFIQGGNTERWTYTNRASAFAGTGWGRIRNATGIYDAMVLEQRLRETGALTRPLSREGRRRLAEVLYLRGALDAVRERPGRALWREIERVLAEDGALQEGGLDPYSVLRAAEPHLGATSKGLTADGVPISPMIRPTGGFVGLRIQDSHANMLVRDDLGSFGETIVDGVTVSTYSNSNSGRSSDSIDRVDGGASGEIHIPIGPPWQLDASSVVLLGLRKEDNYLLSFSQVALAWLAADRWTATANTAYSWGDEDRTDPGTGGDAWSWSAGLTVSWYVEDHTAIELAASENQNWRRGEVDIPTHQFNRGLGASLGVTYRFSGWIATPGFFPALTTLPPVPQAQP